LKRSILAPQQALKAQIDGSVPYGTTAAKLSGNRGRMRREITDRRTQRTRRQLTDALGELIRVKRYESITVQEITDRADVGRSTFYAHFTDKDDLVADSVRRMVGTLEADEAGPRNTLSPSLGLFHHVQEFSEHYAMMARGRHLTLFLDALQSELTAMFSHRLVPRVPEGGAPRVPVPLLAAMLAGLLITAVRTWLESGMAETAEEMNRAYLVTAEAALRVGLRPQG
jgi:AcrR family transcriptional regulator